jgi:predicted nucleotidyltransferase
MLSPTETKILKLLFDNLTKEYTIRGISLSLNLPYPQIHRSINSLSGKKLIKFALQGKNKVISLALEGGCDEYIYVENERKRDLLNKYKLIRILLTDLGKINHNQFICVLFGSYAEKRAKNSSDLDLLFVIPKEYDYGQFERNVKNTLIMPKVDINITTEKGLLEMWNNPMKLNVGNELLKKHIVLCGAEPFLKLRRQYYIGK